MLSFASPCVLPLVPVYISFIAGVSLKELTAENTAKTARRAALINSLFFIFGFSFVFVALGATATALGQAFYDYQLWIQRGGGVLAAIFGLHLLGVFRIGFLQSEKRMHISTKKFGYAGSFLVGIAFGAGWTPCVGPILASILMLASAQESVGRGMLLLSFYSAGIGVPLFAATLGINGFLTFFNRFKKWLRVVEITSGIFLILLGVLLATNKLMVITSFFASK